MSPESQAVALLRPYPRKPDGPALYTWWIAGVKNDGTPNNLQINNSTYYFSNVLFGPLELSVYDGSVVRLQELSLSYAFPQKFLDKTPEMWLPWQPCLKK